MLISSIGSFEGCRTGCNNTWSQIYLRLKEPSNKCIPIFGQLMRRVSNHHDRIIWILKYQFCSFFEGDMNSVGRWISLLDMNTGNIVWATSWIILLGATWTLLSKIVACYRFGNNPPTFQGAVGNFLIRMMVLICHLYLYLPTCKKIMLPRIGSL